MAITLGQWVLRGTGQWALKEKETGSFVGRAGLHDPGRAEWPGVEVGRALLPTFRGRGYATEAGARSLEYPFDDLGAHRVCGVILAESARSQEAARLGLRLTEKRVLSHFPDIPHGIWWATAEEWRRSQRKKERP